MRDRERRETVVSHGDGSYMLGSSPGSILLSAESLRFLAAAAALASAHSWPLAAPPEADGSQPVEGEESQYETMPHTENSHNAD